ncbi:hypothetical protein KBB25_03225 [Candidatus Gracilibacteria bacterium]|nr:hypothetical protein [Candidatus Gracilibacteria bacterium]
MNVFFIALIVISGVSCFTAFQMFKKKKFVEEVYKKRFSLMTEQFEDRYNKLLEECGGESKGKLLFHSIMEKLIGTEIDWFNPKMKSFFFIQTVKDGTYLFEKKEYNEPVVVATIYSHNKSIHLSTAFYKTDAFLEIQKKLQDKSVVSIVSKAS